jgi:Fe-S cluster biosynthesis and repair protein YggX
MAETNARIEQFRKMIDGAPNDPLGHYSLGRALLEGGHFADAERSFARVVELDPKISKAYQLLAEAQLKQERRPDAIETLKRGATIAHERGDAIPKREILGQLREMGVEMPELQHEAAARPVGEGQVRCVRCNEVKPRLVKPPFRNPLGQEIFEKVCNDCWREWIGMGTKVINELRLPLGDPQAQKVYDQHMVEFLNLR